MSPRPLERAEELHLYRILERIFPDLAKSYRLNLDALAAARAGDIRGITWHRDRSGRPLFFRFSLSMPALFLLSESLSRFQVYRQYVVPIEARKFYADLGIIPAYFANLNRISCIKLWGGKAFGYFSPSSRPLTETSVCWRFDEGGSSQAQFSSLNFILKRGAIERELSPSFKEALFAYFRFAFWSKPKLGFTCCPHIIHSRENVSHVLKVSKDIFLVKKIHEPRAEELAPGFSPYVQRVDLEIQTLDGSFKGIFAYVTKDVAKSIQVKLTSELHKILINGLIYDLEGKFEGPHGYGLNLLSVVTDLLLPDQALLKTVAGFLAAERFLNSRSCGVIGSLDELWSEVLRRAAAYARKMVGTSQVSGMANSLGHVLDQLFPIVVYDGKSAFFVHPVILSALLRLGLERVINDRDSTTIIHFIRLLENLRTGEMVNIFGKEMTHFRRHRITRSELLPVLISSLDTIRLSGLLYDHF